MGYHWISSDPHTNGLLTLGVAYFEDISLTLVCQNRPDFVWLRGAGRQSINNPNLKIPEKETNSVYLIKSQIAVENQSKLLGTIDEILSNGRANDASTHLDYLEPNEKLTRIHTYVSRRSPWVAQTRILLIHTQGGKMKKVLHVGELVNNSCVMKNGYQVGRNAAVNLDVLGIFRVIEVSHVEDGCSTA